MLSTGWSGAVHELHDQVVRPDVVELADVRAVERGNGLGFAIEALRELLLADLDRDDPIEPRVLRAIHVAHGAGSDGGENLVGTEAVAGRE